MFYKVAILGLKIPPLTYSSSGEIRIGSLVEVKIKEKKWLGIIWEKDAAPPGREIKEIGAVVAKEFFSIKLLSFYNFVSKYYFVYPSEVLSLAFPGIKRISRSNRELMASLSAPGEFPKQGFGVSLFVGKKEEEKKRFILQRIGNNKGSILYLFPEISWGERIFARLKKEVEEVAFYHSEWKRAERIKIWSESKRGRYRVIIGTKQAVFLPIPNLIGIAIEDEANPLYKEEKRHLHYQARDCAVMRGKIENVPVYLFSHTPSLDSFYYSQKKKRFWFYGGFKKKDVKVVIADLRREDGVLTNSLKRFLAQYRKGEIFYLLVQRQGFSRYIICADCGFIPRCGECGFPFFYHQKELLFSCHICQKKERVFDECPNCQGSNFLFSGVGMERVERELRLGFPQLGPVLGKREGIFLGSSFGLSTFPDGGVDLGAIISFEQLLSFPDFRTEEEAFQIIRTLIGKVKDGGFLIIQTKSPSHPILSNLFNPQQFFNRLLRERESLSFPPFYSVATLKIFSDEAVAARKYEELKDVLSSFREEVKIFPPFKSRRKKHGRYFYTILLKLKSGLRLYNILRKEDLLIAGEEIEVDINPITILT